jgi:hypothetical protein
LGEGGGETVSVGKIMLSFEARSQPGEFRVDVRQLNRKLGSFLELGVGRFLTVRPPNRVINLAAVTFRVENRLKKDKGISRSKKPAVKAAERRYPMAIEKVALSSLIAQAWEQLKGMVLEEVKKRIEELARAEQTSRLGRAPHARGGNSLRRWGYRIRKVLLTPWGIIQGLRLPRIRDVVRRQEVPFLRSERGEYRLAEMLLASIPQSGTGCRIARW